MSRRNDTSENILVFRSRNEDAKSPMQLLVAYIAREVRRNKFSYEQLKYVFASVRQKCEVEVTCKPKRLFELPTDEEITRFFTVIKNPVHSLLFEFLMGTGMRVEELCALELSRLNLADNSVFICQGKGAKDRVTILGNKLVQKLELYLTNRNLRYLFESGRGTRYTTRRIQQICKRYKDQAGITKRFSPHVWRHIWNSKLALHGLPEERRAILAGHEQDSGAQKIYTHLTASGFRNEVIAILDKISL